MTIDFKSRANEAIRHLKPYQPGKPMEELERELGITSSIKLASNENPLGASPKAILAAEQALKRAHIYPDGNYYELKQALAKHLTVLPEQLSLGNGSDNIFELLIKAFLNHDTNVVISQYTFLTIPILLKGYGIPTHVAPALNYGHDVQALLSAIDDKTGMIFLVNPNNPTGTYITDHAFATFMDAVPPHIIVVVDEAYFEFVDVADFPRSLNYLTRYPNLIITRTFSKVYGLAALRVGYAISSPDIADILNRARLPFNVNHIAVQAARAAILDQEHILKTIRLTHQGKQQLIASFNTYALTFIPSVANFVTVEVGAAAEIYEKLLREGVIVRPLNAYDMPRHLRISIGTQEQNDRFLGAFARIR